MRRDLAKGTENYCTTAKHPRSHFKIRAGTKHRPLLIIRKFEALTKVRKISTASQRESQSLIYHSLFV